MKQQLNKSLLKYMTDVAMGMHYLSEKGLIHRVSCVHLSLVEDANTSDTHLDLAHSCAHICIWCFM